MNHPTHLPNTHTAGQRSGLNPEARAVIPRPGFTLVELLVAIAVTGVMIVAVNAIFATVTEAVRRGSGVTEVIGDARVIGDQLARDFENMIGPNEGGFLVIMNYRVRGSGNSGVHMLPEDDYDGDGAVDSNEPHRDWVRSDQIVFIRRRGDLEPMCPGNQNSYSNSSNAAYVRFWLGHALRTNADGSTPGGGLGVAPNQYAGDWILGRQALFLNLDVTGVNNVADGAWFDADTSGMGTGGSLYNGYTDMAEYGLSTEDDGSDNGCMVGGAEPADTLGVASPDRRLWANLPAESTQQKDGYAERAYNYTYATSPAQRLHCNPFPQGYDAWRIGQMHAYLSGHVSDIEIHFAGDYDGNGRIDRSSADDRSGDVTWYGLGETGIPPDGANGFVSRASSSTGPQPIYDGPLPFGGGAGPRDIGVRSADQAYVFRHGSSAANWPYLIRIRYRLLDSRGRVGDADGEPGRWFEQVFPVNRD